MLGSFSLPVAAAAATAWECLWLFLFVTRDGIIWETNYQFHGSCRVGDRSEFLSIRHTQTTNSVFMIIFPFSGATINKHQLDMASMSQPDIHFSAVAAASQISVVATLWKQQQRETHIIKSPQSMVFLCFYYNIP